MSANLGRPSSGHRTGKGQSSSQFPRSSTKESRQLHSSLMLVRLCSKSYMLGFSIMWTKNFQMSKLRLEKAEESEIKLPTFTGSLRKQGNSRENIYFCFINYAKAFNCADRNKLWKAWEYQTILSVSWKTCMQVKKQQLEPNKEQVTGSGLRNEYDRAVCCHPVSLTYTLNTLWEMLGWMSNKLEIRLLREISTTSDMWMTPLNGRKWRG